MSAFRYASPMVFALALSAPALAAPTPLASLAAAVPDAGPAKAESTPKPEITSFAAKLGLGAGVPFGTIGGGLELGHEFVTATAGVGTTVSAGTGWAVGARAYFMGYQHKWRPFVQGVYGVAATYDVQIIGGPGSGSYVGTLQGGGGYVGVDHDVGKPGGFVFSYAVGYLTHAGLPQAVTAALAAGAHASPEFGLPIKFLLSFNYDLAR